MPRRSMNAEMRLMARAAVARKLIAAGELDPYDGLAYVIKPTEGVLQAEARVPLITLVQRIARDAA